MAALMMKLWAMRLLAAMFYGATALMVVQPLHASTSGVIVSGIGGNVEFENAFELQGQNILEGLKTLSPNDDAFTLLTGPDVSRDAVMSAIELQASKDQETFILVLLGHGTIDGRNWRFNIPGDDLSDEDLIAAMAGVSAAGQLVVVATSGSGALLDSLSQPGRVVVTATKSGGEINSSRFGEYFAEAIGSDVADIDRNEILTIGEAWRYANEQVVSYYEDQKQLASEHARIKVNDQADLAVARLGALRLAIDNPEVTVLLEQRLELEKQFNALRDQKTLFGFDEFYEKLEPILLDIATLQQKIDEVTGWEPN
ncbi:MAG: hypothetical protein V3U65_05175 [Granulosicoccaceae bacterium]